MVPALRVNVLLTILGQGRNVIRSQPHTFLLVVVVQPRQVLHFVVPERYQAHWKEACEYGPIAVKHPKKNKTTSKYTRVLTKREGYAKEQDPFNKAIHGQTQMPESRFNVQAVQPAKLQHVLHHDTRAITL